MTRGLTQLAEDASLHSAYRACCGTDLTVN